MAMENIVGWVFSWKKFILSMFEMEDIQPYTINDLALDLDWLYECDGKEVIEQVNSEIGKLPGDYKVMKEWLIEPTYSNDKK